MTSDMPARVHTARHQLPISYGYGGYDHLAALNEDEKHAREIVAKQLRPHDD